MVCSMSFFEENHRKSLWLSFGVMSSNVFMHVSNLNEKLHCACQETKHVCVGQVNRWSSSGIYTKYTSLQPRCTSISSSCRCLKRPLICNASQPAPPCQNKAVIKNDLRFCWNLRIEAASPSTISVPKAAIVKKILLFRSYKIVVQNSHIRKRRKL